jgi:2-alkyl-3-oxoalkanoate reductase
VSEVLVTGATGFVGGRVVRRLRDLGVDVVAPVRSTSDALAELGIEQRTVALQDLEGIQAAAEQARAVVHAAATAGPDHATAAEVNVHGTRGVAGAALLSGLRLIHLSTTSVYDLAAAGSSTVGEHAPLVARDDTPLVSSSGNAYATTKALAEGEVVRAVQNGLVAAILRPPAVLGAGRTSTWGTRVPRRIRDGEAIPIADDSTFGWVHVEDLVDAVLAALDADPEVVRGLTANVVGGHVPFGTYRETVRSIVDGPAVPTPADATAWRGRYATTQLLQTLDVRPSRTFEAAIDEIRTSWEHGDPDA